MGRKPITLAPWIAKLPGGRFLKLIPVIFWALAIDAIDLVSVIVETVGIFFGGAGLVAGLGVDAVQIVLALGVFGDPIMLLTTTDMLLPSVFDIFPATTAVVIARNYLHLI